MAVDYNDIKFHVEKVETPPTLEEKVDHIYAIALKAEKLLEELGPQIGPILEGVSKNPMLKMFLR